MRMMRTAAINLLHASKSTPSFFLKFHELFTGSMKFFEEFVQKSNTVTSEQSIWIDNDEVFTINGGVFDTR